MKAAVLVAFGASLHLGPPCIARPVCCSPGPTTNISFGSTQSIGVWVRPPFSATFSSSATAYGLGMYDKYSNEYCAIPGEISVSEIDPESDSGTTGASVTIFNHSGGGYPTVPITGHFTSSLGTPPFGGCLLPAPDPSDTQLHSVTLDFASAAISGASRTFAGECEDHGAGNEFGFVIGSATLPRSYTVTRSGSGGALEATRCLILRACFRTAEPAT
jgi:hypothetical protein